MATFLKKMNAVARSLKPFLPAFVRSSARKFHTSVVLYEAIRQLRHGRLDARLIEKLAYGWGNWGWSADEDFLGAIIVAARQNKGPVLECGSGASTLLLGFLGQKAGFDVWTLEHDALWGSRVESYLKKLGITRVKICTAPLKSYGSFQWYDPPLEKMPRNFSLVVCDGPPASTPGGRYGLLPIMAGTLSPGALILLHDYGRQSERDVVGKWQEEFNICATPCGEERVYASIRFNGTKK